MLDVWSQSANGVFGDCWYGPPIVRRSGRAAPGVANFFVGKTQRGVDVSVVTDGSSDLQNLRMELIDVLRRHGGPEPEVGVQEVGL